MRVRRGHNGTQAERDAGLERGWQTAQSLKPEGVLMAKYRHRMSRAQDPQLHTHVVIPNMAKGPDGRWTALEHPPLYDYAKSGGALYQAFIRHEVLERAPVGAMGAHRQGPGRDRDRSRTGCARCSANARCRSPNANASTRSPGTP